MKLFSGRDEESDTRLKILVGVHKKQIKEMADSLDDLIERQSRTINGISVVSSSRARLEIRALRFKLLKELEAIKV